MVLCKCVCGYLYMHVYGLYRDVDMYEDMQEALLFCCIWDWRKGETREENEILRHFLDVCGYGEGWLRTALIALGMDLFLIEKLSKGDSLAERAAIWRIH